MSDAATAAAYRGAPDSWDAPHEILIERTFEAPRERVWKAWTEPDQLARWWGGRGWSAQPSSLVMNVCRGGTFRVVTVNDVDGRELVLDGVYDEVVEPERLVFSSHPARDDPAAERTVTTVTFAALGDDRTEMVFHTTQPVRAALHSAAEGSASSAFERLAELLA